MRPFSSTTKVFSQSTEKKYVLHASLSGSRGAVACLSAHPLGTYVASGGDFGTNIWHLPTLQLIRVPAGPGDRGATTALAWITRTDDSDDGLAFGTENGYLCVWKKSLNEELIRSQWTETFCQRLTGGEDSQEIVGMAYDIGSTQLAVIHRSQAVHRFIMNSSMHPSPLISKSILKHWPQAVGFGQTSARGPEIWTFGREDGVM
ncbi:hypothetical protein HHX47_DHR1001085 [Lentinula edodes]|nr:hypothetical protein HHX47_DHR1001085 [Lentinula edodes]